MKKQLIIAAVLLIIGYFLYKQYMKNQKPKEDVDSSNPAPGTQTPQTPTPKEITDKTILDRSMVKTYISQVSWIQYYYNKYVAPKVGKQKILQDGYFGGDTEAAVKLVTGKTKTSWYEFSAKVREKYIDDSSKKEFDKTTGAYKK